MISKLAGIWQLYSVGNSVVALATWFCGVRFLRVYSHWKTKPCKTSAWAAELFYNPVLELVPVPFQVVDLGEGLAAADAHAAAEHAGLGGWWLQTGTHPDKFTVRWFSFKSWDNLPE